MQQHHDKKVDQAKGNSAALIGTALVGAAVGAAAVLATDPDKRTAVVEKSKEVKERVGRAVGEIKKKKDEFVTEAQDAMKEDDAELI